MGTLNLIKRALHPGTSLKHDAEKVTPVDALHALALAPAEGSVLVHARLGQDNIEQLKVVVHLVAMEVFAQRGWTITGKRMSPEECMRRFVEQTWREYMGEPCHTCRGHGYTGRKLDLVRHRLNTCGACHGDGYVMLKGVRHVCPRCHGKTLIAVVEEIKAKRLRPCDVCLGSGVLPASHRVRAKALGCDHMHVKRVWRERFRVVLMTLRAHERDALVSCAAQLFGED